MADPDVFKIFKYDFAGGDPATALVEPNTVVLMDELAEKLFGTADPINQTISIGTRSGKTDYKVTGVFRKPIFNSHIQARFFMSMSSDGMGAYFDKMQQWAGNNLMYSYVVLQSGTDPATVEAKFPAFLEKYAKEQLAAMGFQKTHFLQPVTDIHLKSDFTNDLSPNSSMTLMYVLGSISVFILLIACINFMNLATARSAKRAKEVGVRKVLGARKAMLIRQFLSESMMITLIALTIALALIEFLLPAFNQLTHKNLALNWLSNADALGWMVLFALITGLLAGSYPAWYLSSLNPTAVLKGSLRRQGAMNFLRKGLVVFQFTISIALIIGTLMIHRQMDFIQTKNLGFGKDQRLIIPLRTAESQHTIAAFKNEILKNSECVSAGPTTSYPGIFTPNDLSFYKEGEDMNSAVNMKFSYVDYGFIETLGCEVLQGRSFAESYPSDLEKGIVINEAAARSMGWKPEEAAGKKIYSDWNKTKVAFEVVGVVRDFNHQSLYQEIRPYFFLLSHDVRYSYMMVHVHTQNFQPLLVFLEDTWKKLNPGEPFEYSFFDQDIQKQYEADIRLSSLINDFAAMAILIACLGLFGLASYTTEQRTKEIGIRKVLGASSASIVNMLSTEFVKLVIVANLIAWPLAYFVLNRWLEAFAYKVSWDAFVFLIACGTALLIAFLTVSGQALKAALTNPSEVLKYE
ncbi:FtsX-like permease family protein [bacterium]|nr:FtsX-like permease family protein [bacterium]